LVLTNNGNVDIHPHADEKSCTLELLEGGRAIGLDGQAINSSAVGDAAEAPASEAPAEDPAPKKRAKKEKNPVAKSGEDVANPAEAAHEAPMEEQHDEQTVPAEKADGNAKRRKKASKVDVAAPEVAADDAPTQDQENAEQPLTEEVEPVGQEKVEKGDGTSKRRKKA
jgi:ribonuclease E